MKIVLNLNFDEELLKCGFLEKYELTIIDENKIILSINLNLEDNYLNTISDYEAIRTSFNKMYNNDYYLDSDDDIKDYLNREDTFYETLYNNIDYIRIDGTITQILKYILLNPILMNKKIILNKFFKYNDDLGDYAIFKNYNNIYINTEGNSEPILINEFIKTKEKLDDIVSDAKKYNFSPIELCMYLYDKLRTREYIHEDDNESYTVSRDLSKVLFGDKIVCLGYANIFDVVLKKIGFKSKIFYLEGKDGFGHARNLVYIIDNKYNIDGVYLFDATWDSKKNHNNKYLYSYKFFAKTFEEMDELTKEDDDYINLTFKEYNSEMIDRYINILENKGIESVPVEMTETVNEISKFIDGEKLIDKFWYIPESVSVPSNFIKVFNKENIIERLKKYDSLLNKTIDANILLKVLYNVRKIEYYNEPEKYPFDINALYNVLLRSKWNFNDSEYNLMNAIFGNDNKIIKELKRRNTIKFIRDNDIEMDINHIKLTRTLRKVYDKKIKDE